MKKVMIAFLMIATLMSCQDETTNNDDMTEATILGRWVPEGFEDNVRYLITEDKIYTVYHDGNGEFPTNAEIIADNPVTLTHDYVIEGEVVVTDLNFGNFDRWVPSFHCENEVLHLNKEDGSSYETYYREGHDISDCN